METLKAAMEDAEDQGEASTEVVDDPVGPESLSQRDSSGEAQTEDEELDEEDAWIAEEIARQERELREEEAIDGERYVPQLMDTLEMRALQSALRRTEAQFEREARVHPSATNNVGRDNREHFGTASSQLYWKLPLLSLDE